MFPLMSRFWKVEVVREEGRHSKRDPSPAGGSCQARTNTAPPPPPPPPRRPPPPPPPPPFPPREEKPGGGPRPPGTTPAPWRGGFSRGGMGGACGPGGAGGWWRGGRTWLASPGVCFQPCCRQGVGPRGQARKLWDVGRNSCRKMPRPRASLTPSLPVPRSGQAIAAPSAHFAGLAPHPMPPRGFFPFWIRRLFCLLKQNKPNL